jgi:hypothetical protein
MNAILSDCESVMLYEFLPPKTKINSNLYFEALKNCPEPLNERDQDD